MKTLKWILLLMVMSIVTGLAASEEPASVKVEVCRQKEALVQLRPVAGRAGNLVVKSISRGTLHFYVFDLSGNMVFHALLLPGTSRNIEALKNGEYSYDVFQQDVGVEQGKISVHIKARAV